MANFEPMQYLTFDPGGTTGWACFRPVTNKYNTGQASPDKIWSILEQAKHVYDLEGPIIFERFDFRQGMPKIDFRPIKVIGVIEEWTRQNDWPLVLQSPAEGKSYFTDNVLKNSNLWIPGKPHAMDALRHLLYFRQAFTLVKDENTQRLAAYEKKHK